MSSTEWDHVGRELLRNKLAHHRHEVDDAFRDVEESLATLDEDGEFAGDLDPADVRALRLQLDEARHAVETYAARVTDGVEPWDEPPQTVPYGVYAEVLDE